LLLLEVPYRGLGIGSEDAVDRPRIRSGPEQLALQVPDGIAGIAALQI
jgi:hypothetical protein